MPLYLIDLVLLGTKMKCRKWERHDQDKTGCLVINRKSESHLISHVRRKSNSAVFNDLTLKCIGSDYYNLTEPSYQIFMVSEPIINLGSATCGNQEKKEGNI